MFIYMVILTTAGARPPRLERGRGVRGVRHGVAAVCLHRGIAAEPGGLIGSGEPGPRWLRMRGCAGEQSGIYGGGGGPSWTCVNKAQMNLTTTRKNPGLLLELGSLK